MSAVTMLLGEGIVFVCAMIVLRRILHSTKRAIADMTRVIESTSLPPRPPITSESRDAKTSTAHRVA